MSQSSSDSTPQAVPPGEPAEPSSEQSRQSLFRRTRSLGLLTLLSRILGMIRDSVMAMLFGNSAISDAFTLAFRIPNMARQLFGEGALSAAFLPVFLRDIEQHGKQTAFRTASAVLLVAAGWLLALVLLTEVVALTVRITIPLSYEADLLLGLIAALSPYLLLVCLLAQASAILHGLGEFSVPGWFPVLLNALWISVAIVLGQLDLADDTRVYSVAFSIVVIGVFQLLLSIPTLKRLGFEFHWDWSSSRSRVREIMQTMIPVLLGLSVTQLNTVCDSLIAWGFTAPAGDATGLLNSYPVTEGTTAALYYAQRLYQFPLGVFGVALGTVIFPLLTMHAARGEFDHFREDLSRGVRMVIAIGLPASAGLFVVAVPLTQVIFERGDFTHSDTLQTAGMVEMYAIAVWASCLLMIAHRACYALGDRTAPLRIGIAAVILNLIANLALIWPLQGRGLALATAVSAIFQTLLVMKLLSRRLNGIHWQSIGVSLMKTTIATTAMTTACVALRQLLPDDPHMSVHLAAIVSAGGIVYLATAFALKLPEPFELISRKATRQK
jgi:putative peptidoglycan lipid II flippase